MDRAPEPFVMPLKAHSDSRGMLVAIEGARDIPFDIARVYYIIGTEGAQRGFHAHRELEQLLIAVSGSCRLTIDDGVTREDVILDRPDVGVHIDHMHWLEMRDFAPNTVSLCWRALRTVNPIISTIMTASSRRRPAGRRRERSVPRSGSPSPGHSRRDGRRNRARDRFRLVHPRAGG